MSYKSVKTINQILRCLKTIISVVKNGVQMGIQCLYQSVWKYLTGASTSVPSPQCSMG